MKQLNSHHRRDEYVPRENRREYKSILRKKVEALQELPPQTCPCAYPCPGWYLRSPHSQSYYPFLIRTDTLKNVEQRLPCFMVSLIRQWLDFNPPIGKVECTSDYSLYRVWIPFEIVLGYSPHIEKVGKSVAAATIHRPRKMGPAMCWKRECVVSMKSVLRLEEDTSETETFTTLRHVDSEEGSDESTPSGGKTNFTYTDVTCWGQPTLPTDPESERAARSGDCTQLHNSEHSSLITTCAVIDGRTLSYTPQEARRLSASQQGEIWYDWVVPHTAQRVVETFLRTSIQKKLISSVDPD